MQIHLILGRKYPRNIRMTYVVEFEDEKVDGIFYLQQTPWFYATKKLKNINKNIFLKKLMVYYDDLYWYNFSFLYLLVNTNKKIPSMYKKKYSEKKIKKN